MTYKDLLGKMVRTIHTDKTKDKTFICYRLGAFIYFADATAFLLRATRIYVDSVINVDELCACIGERDAEILLEGSWRSLRDCAYLVPLESLSLKTRFKHCGFEFMRVSAMGADWNALKLESGELHVIPGSTFVQVLEEETE